MTRRADDSVESGVQRVSRRTVLRATAWSAPVVAMVTVAPAAAAASVNLPHVPHVTIIPPPIPGGVPPGGPPTIVVPPPNVPPGKIHIPLGQP
jgi:hypothetical protein